MKTEPKIFGDHVIYGDWDDTFGYQVLIHYHPNGIHCTAFVMDGCDYGGGISRYWYGLSSEVEDIYSKAVSDYEFHKQMTEWCRT